ncbi:MAG: hypothetical protein COA97_11975 [Flavobacteriales bacterium]|nr:MAG: hypothetical protein COA97_11975 [Flavobacteriales bacterium]
MEDTKKDTKKEAKRGKMLGYIGELIAMKTLSDKGFKNIKNLNDIKENYPFADVYAEKDGKNYVINVKTRNKYKEKGELNADYNLLQSKGKDLENAKKAEENHNAEAYWIAIPFEEKTFSIYFGSVKELINKGMKNILLKECANGNIGECLIEDKKHKLDWDCFTNQTKH